MTSQGFCHHLAPLSVQLSSTATPAPPLDAGIIHHRSIFTQERRPILFQPFWWELEVGEMAEEAWPFGFTRWGSLNLANSFHFCHISCPWFPWVARIINQECRPDKCFYLYNRNCRRMFSYKCPYCLSIWIRWMAWSIFCIIVRSSLWASSCRGCLRNNCRMPQGSPKFPSLVCWCQSW